MKENKIFGISVWIEWLGIFKNGFKDNCRVELLTIEILWICKWKQTF